MRVTINAVNAAIKAHGSDFELVRGKGYFYFISPSHQLYEESVHTPRVTDFTTEAWLRQLHHRIEQTNARTLDNAYLIPQLKQES